MAVAEESGGGIVIVIDESYEFSAPRFFDFMRDESEEDTRRAELWFDTAISYAPSPFMPRIKADRPFTGASLCDFSEADETQKTSAPSASKNDNDDTLEINIQTHCTTAKTKEEAPCSEAEEENGKSAFYELSANVERIDDDCKEEGICLKVASGEAFVEVGQDACTPNLAKALQKRARAADSKKQQTAKKTSLIVKNPSAMKSIAGTTQLAQENQAIKRQKLEEGKTRQILHVKGQSLPHKSKLGLTTSNFTSSNCSKTHRENRKVYVRETSTPASTPFVSMAEMMKKFQSSTRDLSFPNVNSTVSHGDATSMIQRKPKLTLTRPIEPEFETAQRVRSVRVKSAAELEEEMMAEMPKFKARPLNKKILQAPTLPPVPRSTPQPPEFKEFHLETMARAYQNADSASIASTDLSQKQGNPWKSHLTEPKTPVLQTSLRARPSKVKSSLEVEQGDLEKIPKFKARPLNKKIFESKGDLGIIFFHAKKHVTQPQEFHFATNERIPPPAAVADLFDKLSLKSEPAHNNIIPRNTSPNPFYLRTEERGAEKEKKLFTELLQKQLEDERARVPKANPYPYTTDYPVVQKSPPKPEFKQCTKPEPFQLESLVRHEEEMQRTMEERQIMEREEAKMRIFKAQPILKEDPIPLPEKDRKPLTQVQGFKLHVDNRSVDRTLFNEKIKEKEMMFKRYREESEAARMIEEEKVLKQLRRTIISHARPVPNFGKPFCPQKSAKETTKPKSPNLRVLQRKDRRKMLNGTIVSSPAASMR